MKNKVNSSSEDSGLNEINNQGNLRKTIKILNEDEIKKEFENYDGENIPQRILSSGHLSPDEVEAIRKYEVESNQDFNNKTEQEFNKYSKTKG